jgi:hypothetical protein
VLASLNVMLGGADKLLGQLNGDVVPEAWWPCRMHARR